MKLLLALLMTLATAPAWAVGEPEPDTLLLAQADSCRAQYDYYHAMLLYRQVLSGAVETTEASRLTATRRLAQCCFLRADYRGCIALLEKLPAEALDHDDLRQLFYSNKALSQKKQQMGWGRRLLERFPMDSEVVADMAQELNLDTPEEALRLTQRYEAEDSTHILVKRQRADAQFFLKQYAEARHTYERLLALGDSTFAVHYSLGMCYEQLADEAPDAPDTLLLARAVAHYGQAVTLNDSTKAWPLYHLGAALVKLGQPARGVHVLLMALQRMQPDDAVMFNLHWALADGYYRNEEFYSAIYDWKNCLRYNPQSLASLYNIARTYELIETDGVKAEEAYVDFMKLAITAPTTTPALEEWMAHAESFGQVKAKTDEIRQRRTALNQWLRELNEKGTATERSE